MFVDSWAWIEFFNESANCMKIRGILEGKELYTSVLCIAEVALWCSRNGVASKKYVDEIKKNAVVLLVNNELAEKAGNDLSVLRKKSRGMGLVDSILYCQALSINELFLTGDSLFIDLPGVVFVS